MTVSELKSILDNFSDDTIIEIKVFDGSTYKAVSTERGKNKIYIGVANDLIERKND